MEAPAIRPAGEADIDSVLGVITLAFSTDPFVRWLTPDTATYVAMMPRVSRTFGASGFAHGTVDYLSGGAGAAMWVPPGVTADMDALGKIVATSAQPELLPDIDAFFQQVEEFHPTEPHWYLPLIGVDPAHHGEGLGTALMRHALRRADADGVPAYLESSNPRNIPFYQGFGFEIIGAIQAGSSPQVVPMLRRSA
jgi:ribosomal protein S18 acetylase RimI-like enzyme